MVKQKEVRCEYQAKKWDSFTMQGNARTGQRKNEGKDLNWRKSAQVNRGTSEKEGSQRWLDGVVRGVVR